MLTVRMRMISERGGGRRVRRSIVIMYVSMVVHTHTRMTNVAYVQPIEYDSYEGENREEQAANRLTATGSRSRAAVQ